MRSLCSSNSDSCICMSSAKSSAASGSVWLPLSAVAVAVCVCDSNWLRWAVAPDWASSYLHSSFEVPGCSSIAFNCSMFICAYFRLD